MERKRRFGKAAAVASSLALLILYVYDRGGGNLLGAAPNARQSQVLPSSKSKQIILAPGSKSAAVFPAEPEPAVVATNQRQAAAARAVEREFLRSPAASDYPRLPASEPAVLPGSKAAIILRPTQSTAKPRVVVKSRSGNGPNKAPRAAAQTTLKRAARQAKQHQDPFSD
jgi:hypothetical protein